MAPTVLTLGRWAEVPAHHPLVASLEHRFTIDNPEYEQAQRMGFSTRGIARTLELFEREPRRGTVRFPRTVADAFQGSQTLPVVDVRAPGEDAPMQSLMTLRPHQVPFVNELVTALTASPGAVGQAAAGFGKTVCALAAAAQLGKKTLILVHKEFLMTQWVERILGTVAAAKRLGLSAQGLSSEPMAPMLDVRPEEVGIIQQDTCEWRGRKIVVAMAQSLTAREYEAAMYESFGLVIVDEVHRFAAPTFLQTIVQFPAAMRLGVTATPDRKDKMEQVFFAHIGRIAAVGQGHGLKPRVNFLRTPVVVTATMQRQLERRGRPDMTKVVTFLCEHEARNRQIVRQLIKAVDHQRKVLVLSDRRKHLDDLRAMFLEAIQRDDTPRIVSTAYYVGGMKLAERKEAEKMQVLFATYAMAAEGLDIPQLDTLMLVTPKSAVHQTVGRIIRVHSDKKTPVVVDFVDTELGLCRALARKREDEYRALGWWGDDPEKT